MKPRGVQSLVLCGPMLSAARWAEDQRASIAAMPSDIQQAIREGEESGHFEAQAYQDAMMAFYRRHVCRLDPWPTCLTRAIDQMGHAVDRALQLAYTPVCTFSRVTTIAADGFIDLWRPASVWPSP